MPGTFYEIKCPGCARVHEIWLGGDVCRGSDHTTGPPRQWHYEQFACHRCGLIASEPVGCSPSSEEPRCPRCSRRLAPWQSEHWRDIPADDLPAGCRLHDTCPACGAFLSREDIVGLGDWD